MVSLITAAFPAEGLIERRTNDADAGITVELASSGALHHDLISIGYEAEVGNRYIKAGNPRPTIDVLVPSLTGKFGNELRGDRAFDKVPGLDLALFGPGLAIDVTAALLDGTELSMIAVVPSVEGAVILKAYAWHDRKASTVKDAVDISNLFHVLDQHGPEKLGGWRLDAQSTGSRRDAAGRLHLLADDLDAGKYRRTPLPARKLVTLIRKYVIRP